MTTLTAESSILASWRVRVAGLLIAALAATPLTVAATLHANPTGTGTHEQLGLPPCTTLMYTGWPCPSCGMTTAFAAVMHGEIFRAVLTQPAGAIAALVCVMAMAAGLFVALSGRDIRPQLRWLWTMRTVYAAGLIVLISWAYKSGVVKGVFGV